MIGGGIAGILALQAAGAFDSYKREEPSYTVKHSYPCSSPTASVTTCVTACETASVTTCATACEFVCSTGCIGEDYESRY